MRGVEETTREDVSAAKKIVHDAEKVAQTRAEIEFVKKQILPQCHILGCWLGCQDSNLGMA